LDLPNICVYYSRASFQIQGLKLEQNLDLVAWIEVENLCLKIYIDFEQDNGLKRSK